MDNENIIYIITEIQKCINKALEKQIPRKPIEKLNKGNELNKWEYWVCPCCGWLVGQKEYKQQKSEYCSECGQKIDWN